MEKSNKAFTKRNIKTNTKIGEQMRTLKEYQNKHQLSLRAFGKLLGVKGSNTAVNVMRWIKSERIPSVRYMKTITEKTKITPNDIYKAYYDKNNI